MDKYYINLIERVNSALIDGIDDNKGGLEDSIFYALSLKGKRLRPLLFLTLLDSFDKDLEKSINIAVAIEYIHTYSLIHDDLPAMDNDDIRRGMPTVHKKFNEAIGLLAGDVLLTMAFEKIVFADIDSTKKIEIIKILTYSIGINGMAGGQALDLSFNGDKRSIMEIHEKKTAELIKGTLLSAAEIIGMSSEKKKKLSKVGEKIGVGFQLADDLLDIKGNEYEVGKKVKKDISNESPNSVIYFGLDKVENMINELYKKSISGLKDVGIESDMFLNLVRMMFYRRK